jgi:hypothetical protein
MTPQAQIVLYSLFEGQMALMTLRLIRCMGLRDRPRHNQALDIRIFGGREIKHHHGGAHDSHNDQNNNHSHDEFFFPASPLISVILNTINIKERGVFFKEISPTGS